MFCRYIIHQAKPVNKYICTLNYLNLDLELIRLVFQYTIAAISDVSDLVDFPLSSLNMIIARFYDDFIPLKRILIKDPRTD